MQREKQTQLAVAFLASDVNRFSINALTGAIEQDQTLEVTLAFPHPRDAQTEIERLLTGAQIVVVAFSFMSSALLSTRQALQRLRASFARERERVLFVAGGPHASGDASGTLAMGFDVVFIGEGERSFPAFLRTLTTSLRDFSDIPGLAILDQKSERPRVMRTGRVAPIELDARYPSIGLRHRRLGSIEIGRGCRHACGFCQTPFLHGARMMYLPLDNFFCNIDYFITSIFTHI